MSLDQHGTASPDQMDFTPQPPGIPPPDGRDLGDRAWSRVRFDIVLAVENLGA
jgi:hypothetical protein